MSNFVFRNFNGLYQLRLETPDDLPLIHELEEARWRATSAPTEQLFCDAKFLEYVDADSDRRIRVNDVKAAQKWLWAQLANRAGVIARSDVLQLGHLDHSSAEVAGMKSLADRIIRERGWTKPDEVTLAEVRAFRDTYAKRFPNGDGVLTAAQLADAPSVAALHAEVMSSTGGTLDLSGEKGIRAADLDAFLELAKKYLAWDAEAHSDEEHRKKREPLGADTPKAAALVAEITPKFEQFFAQCNLVALDPKAAAARLDANAEMLAAIDVNDTAAVEKWLAGAPIARPNAEALIDFNGKLNPYYVAKIEELRTEVLAKLVKAGERPFSRFDRSEWHRLRGLFAPYNEWHAQMPAGIRPGLSAEQLRAFVEGPDVVELRARILRDQEASTELKELNNLEKLILYQQWFLELVNNFVSFPHLFVPGERSLFETGTLILDGRAISLCVLVTDRAAHKKVAEASQMFVVYVELNRKEGDKMLVREVAGAVTAGTRGGIATGKRGIFYDRDRKEWDARVVDVISAPISLVEAAVAPFVRLQSFIGQRIEKMTSSKLDTMEGTATKATEKGMESAAARAAQGPPAMPAAPAQPAAPAAAGAPKAPAGAPPPPPGAAGGALGTLLVGGGVAVAAIGSTVAFVVKTLADIDVINALTAVASVALGVALLSGFLGWLKLRKRDVSTLLEACGWALNGRMYLTRRLSLLFTQEPELPEGSRTERPLITSKHIVAAEKRRMQKQRRVLVRVLVIGAVIAGAIYWEQIWAWMQPLLGGV